MTDNLSRCGYALCHYIGRAVRGEQTSPDSFPFFENPDDMIALAKAHRLVPIAYHSLKLAGFEANSLAELEQPAKALLFKQLKYQITEETLSSAFSAAEIPHMVLKGSELQKYYPRGMVRVCSDIDFYVPPSYGNAALNAAEKLGFENRSLYEGTYHLEKAPRYYVEIHTELENARNKKESAVLREIAERATKNSHGRCRLCNEDLYVHTLFHLYKHYSHCGAGIKFFLDMYVLSRSLAFERETVLALLERVELKRFHDVVLALCLALFEGKKLPQEKEILSEYIFSSGAFGSDTDNFFRSNIIMSNRTSAARANTAAQLLGLQKSNMLQKYPVLKKAPVLYPFCHVHRAVKGVLTKPRVLKSSARKFRSITNRKDMKLYEQLMRQAGLIRNTNG